jgi:tetratricopeptide (TPR) repeat protein
MVSAEMKKARAVACRLILAVAAFIVLGLVRADAQQEIDHGATGTANHDYFTADQEPQTQILLRHVENFHLINSPHNPGGGGTIGNIRDGKYQWALEDLTYVLERFVNHPKALGLLGIVAKLTKNPPLPLSYYQRALSLYPQHALTHAQYGAYLVEIGKTNEGISNLQKALELSPQLAFAYTWLAKAYEKNGDQERMRWAQEQARQAKAGPELS